MQSNGVPEDQEPHQGGITVRYYAYSPCRCPWKARRQPRECLGMNVILKDPEGESWPAELSVLMKMFCICTTQ